MSLERWLWEVREQRLLRTLKDIKAECNALAPAATRMKADDVVVELYIIGAREFVRRLHETRNKLNSMQ